MSGILLEQPIGKTPAGENRPAVTVAPGDGIGPEIMAATLQILEAAGAELDLRPIEMGEQVYRQGVSSGIPEAAWDSLRETGVLLKGPITTPQGGGYKSLNVTLRKTLGLYANVRPCVAFAPYVPTKHPGMDVVVIRENEEDTYGGIEHKQTQDVVQCLKLITRPGCERIAEFAFRYAVANGRKKITCLTKDNIMKLTDGLFRRVFEEIAQDYPQLETEHRIIDIGTARLATQPEEFDVVLAPNLYGDIVSDVTAEMTGSVGMAGSANIGEHLAMFEAIHGSAPDIAGQDMANPSGLLMGAVQMLVHVGQPEVATRIHNAWLRTIEDGLHTADIYGSERSRERVGTKAFGEAVIARLGQKPQQLRSVRYDSADQTGLPKPKHRERSNAKKELVGVDVFIGAHGQSPDALARQLRSADTADLELVMITNRGVKVWPNGFPETFCVDHWRCRFQSADNASQVLKTAQVLELLGRVDQVGLEIIKTEHLYRFDGEAGFSLGQGQ